MRAVHIRAACDTFPHEENEDCMCGPEARLVHTDEHGDVWKIIHWPLELPEGTTSVTYKEQE